MKKYPLLIIMALLTIVSTTAGCQYLPGEFNNLVKANEPPVAYIDSISPTEAMPGETIAFIGHGTDTNGSVVAYRWQSNIDGELSVKDSFQTTSLSKGHHTINFKVQDNNGEWSEEISCTLIVKDESSSLPVISYFSASPTSIVQGNSSKIGWEVLNASSVTIQPDIGDVALAGTKTVSPGNTTTYTLVATNEKGSVNTAIKITVSATNTGLPTINSFAASPAIIALGSPSVLSWNVSNATRVSISPGIGTVDSIGSTMVTPTGTTNYTLMARNSAGQVSYNISVVLMSLPLSEYTVIIEPVTNESGYVQSNGDAWPTLIYAGDTMDNLSIQSFVSFNISSIPSGAIVQDVIVDFSDYSSIEGTPFSDLGCIKAFVHNYGTLDSGDYFTGAQQDQLFQYCSISSLSSHTSGKVKSTLQSKVGTSRFQIRLQFADRETDAHNDDDLIHWSPQNMKLIVTYTTV
jgi:hypothetical protein